VEQVKAGPVAHRRGLDRERVALYRSDLAAAPFAEIA
jgi:hypothetical protein